MQDTFSHRTGVPAISSSTKQRMLSANPYYSNTRDKYIGQDPSRRSDRSGKENVPDDYRRVRTPLENQYTIVTPSSVLMHSQYVPLGQLQDVITLSTVNQTSRRKHARGAPIQKLPAEMLGNIFAFCQTEWNCVSVESLMAVSSTWMGVCLGMPSLWTKISLHMTHWDIPNLSQMRSNYVYHHIVRSGVGMPKQSSTFCSTEAPRIKVHGIGMYSSFHSIPPLPADY